jgi:uncharacterized cupredoxin-like copper-binding protein
MRNTFIIGLMAITVGAAPLLADESKKKTERFPDLEIGLGDAGFGVKQGAAEMKAGTPYRMWLKSTGKKECAFKADAFFQNVTWRKIEVNKVEIKPTAISEIEFEQEGSAELFFTPTKPGDYTWVCEGLGDKGMTGKFVVK